MSPTTNQWPRAMRLRDGSEVLVRPLESADASELGAAIDRLSPESRYRRFLSPIPKLPAAHLRALTDVDHHPERLLLPSTPRVAAASESPAGAS